MFNVNQSQSLRAVNACVILVESSPILYYVRSRLPAPQRLPVQHSQVIVLTPREFLIIAGVPLLLYTKLH